MSGEYKHDWELVGGSVVQNSKPGIPQGVALWQCGRCGLALSRALTARNEKVNGVVPEPETDQECVEIYTPKW